MKSFLKILKSWSSACSGKEEINRSTQQMLCAGKNAGISQTCE